MNTYTEIYNKLKEVFGIDESKSKLSLLHVDYILDSSEKDLRAMLLNEKNNIEHSKVDTVISQIMEIREEYNSFKGDYGFTYGLWKENLDKEK